MSRLSSDELRDLIAGAPDDFVVDETPARPSKPAPPGVKSMPDRAALAAKVARVRGIDAPDHNPPALNDDESQFVERQVETGDGTVRKATVFSKRTGNIIAEQG